MSKGDIGTVLDSLVFDAVQGEQPDLLHVSGDVYAVAYRGPYEDGFLKTFSISAAGDIGAEAIDTFEFQTTRADHPQLIHVSGSVYAIVYATTAGICWVVTISISAAGDIGAGLIDSFELTYSYHVGTKICHVSGDVFAVVVGAAVSHGFLTTISISAAGDIGASEIDHLEFDTTYCAYPSIVRVSSTMFAIAYSGPDLDGFLKTISISIAGDIGAEAIDTLEFDAVDCVTPRIINISGNIFAIAYTSTANIGVVKTVSISAAGDIGAEAIDTLIFEGGTACFIDFLLCSPNLCAVVYQGPDSDGYVKTFSISDAGDISATVIDFLEFDPASCEDLSFRHVSGDIFSIAYSNASLIGTLATFDLETSAAVAPKHLLLMGVG